MSSIAAKSQDTPLARYGAQGLRDQSGEREIASIINAAYRLARLAGKTAMEAERVVETAFARAARRIALGGSVEELRPWLLRQTLLVLGDRWAAPRDRDVVAVAMCRVPEPFRTPTALFFVADLTYRELADAAECSIRTARARLHRGRRMLHDALVTGA
jgi:DNA-directed RNA polymerase specialized sigma24 family protein